MDECRTEREGHNSPANHSLHLKVTLGQCVCVCVQDTERLCTNVCECKAFQVDGVSARTLGSASPSSTFAASKWKRD